jgi:phosphohistidine swiveling domain-containing protein
MSATDIGWILSDTGYPGETPEKLYTEKLASGPQRLSESDLSDFWLIDYRNPAGFTPLGMTHLELGYCWGAQAAAASASLPESDGYEVRLVGPYCYSTNRPVLDSSVMEARLEKMRRQVDLLPDSFEIMWRAERTVMTELHHRFRATDLSGLTMEQLGGELHASRDFMKWLWERHFALMYPLLALQNSAYACAHELEISRGELADLLKGEPSAVSETDAGLANLALLARSFGIEHVLKSALPSQRSIYEELVLHGGEAARWICALQEFLTKHGWRAEVNGDPSVSPWCDDPRQVIRLVLSLLAKGGIASKNAALHQARELRDELETSICKRLSTPERSVFQHMLSDLRRANLVWWQEDHNAFIDMSAILPLRRVALELGRRLKLDAPEDGAYLFCRELLQATVSPPPPAGLRRLVEERKSYHEHWKTLRTALPRHFGNVPERIDDPVYVEIEGLTPQYLDGLRGAAPSNVLTGRSACGGRIEGLARIIFDATDLSLVQEGEILVCEGSTPSWTHVFGRISACLVDQGGTLSHTAIIAREHSLPCIVAMGNATRVIKTGDRLRVDATAGRVEVVGYGG